jgi:uncharacterized membrane protein YfcA
VIAAGYALALVIGLSLGLLGGGGAILTVPVLHYVLGYGFKVAVPMSLVVVGLTSGFGAVAHWRSGTVNARAALAFGPPAIVGAVLGAELGLRVEERIQLTIFAVTMLVAAVSMYLGQDAIARTARRRAEGGAAPLPFITLIGALVGLLTGFVGVGGGFIYVPALVLLAGIAMKEAVGTSLVMIMLSCVAGMVRYQGTMVFDWTAIALFTAIAFVGVAIGSRLARHVSPERLRKVFAGFLLVMGALVLLLGR